MDNEKALKARIMEILKNHDQETKVIHQQIAAERASLEADLEDILSRSYPSGGMSDTGVRVQSSPDPDKKMISMVVERDRRRNQADEAINALEVQLRQIEAVKIHIYSLDTQSKCVLLTLYYPYRTYDESAEILNMDRTTVYRQRQAAIKKLTKRAKKSFEDNSNINSN